ncbi:hypothetical protein ACFXGA_31480 [Actinosynnema sp. NPDC059335]|uniref:hypothetical protein n=1 Tax=Actinosynnema sp. NPDC059335 TaxID=3346804 RepID=UPI00366B2CCA
MLDVIDPGRLTGADEVVDVLRAAGTVGRWRNPDLWDALATSIVRQVIRAGQARKLYGRSARHTARKSARLTGRRGYSRHRKPFSHSRTMSSPPWGWPSSAVR